MPYLVSVTGSRFPLRRGHCYVLGRDNDCDLVIDDAVCSRRHATISVAETADEVSIDDMDSRNGTYLNGRPLNGATIVPDGGRLRVGSTIYLFQTQERAALADIEQTCTGSGDINIPSDIDGGEISALGVLESLRLLVMARRSVTMHVALPEAQARVDIRNGEIVSARIGGLVGFNALVKLAREPSGIFWLIEAKGHADRNIDQPSAHLLFELGRCLGHIDTPVSR